MSNKFISGFSDEICDDFEMQLKNIKKIGMSYISLRGVNGRNFNDLTIKEVQNDVVSLLDKYGVKVSSIGSPIGKVFIDDIDGYEQQKKDLELMCEKAKLIDCKYIRVFSFYINQDEDIDSYYDEVYKRTCELTKIAQKHNLILLHENEKDIFGDTASRCAKLIKDVDSKHYRAIFDFANFVQVNEDVIEAYNKLEEYVDYIHIKDAKFDLKYNVLCGTGDGQIEELLSRFFRSGYNGFLTLEPHLAMFGSLKSLELEEADSVISGEDISGYEGYEMQYKALNKILKNLGVTYG